MVKISNTFVEIKKMDRLKYFKQSKLCGKNIGHHIDKHLKQAGLIKDGVLDVDQLRQMVLTGKVWSIRGIGETSIMSICDWLEEQDEKDEAKK